MTTRGKPVGTPAIGGTSPAASDAKNLTAETRQPGHLRGTATLVIHTHQAQRLLRGRPKTKDQARIVGLYHFSRLMRAIGATASQGDPDAERCRLQVLAGIEEARTDLGRLQQHVEARLQSMPSIEVSLAYSASPVRVPLRLGNPYGYMGAYLIADFDRLMSTVLTAEHMGLVTRDRGQQLTRRGSRVVRRVFTIPLGWWRLLAITRYDAHQNNQLVRQGRETTGDRSTTSLPERSALD